jgi:hypothetical protein
MASKYAKVYSVPEGFPDVLRDLTREVLREFPREHEPQPKDAEWWILDFAARYFGQRVAMAGAATSAPYMRDLQARITAIFQEADKDSNGYLDHREFRSVSALSVCPLWPRFQAPSRRAQPSPPLECCDWLSLSLST